MQRNIYVLMAVVSFTVAPLISKSTQGQSRNRPQPKPTASAPHPAEQGTPNVQPQKKRPVVVTLKEGGPVNGNFVDANNGVLHVEVAGNLLKINLDDVVSVSFSGDAGNGSAKASLPPPVNKTNEAAVNALRALRKMMSATEVGISYQEYGSRLIDLKAEVDEALSQMQPGDLKTEISSAMEAYADASTAWSTALQHGRDSMFPDLEPATSLIRKYDLPIDRSIGMPLVMRSVALSKIWGMARNHIERASALMNAEASAPNSTAVSSQPSSNSVAGIWKLELTGENNRKEIWTLDIQEEGGRFSGTIRNQYGKFALDSISVQGNSFEFTVSDAVKGSGKAEADKVSGTMVIKLPTGVPVSIPFTGTRVM
jgi:hypothetical protein